MNATEQRTVVAQRVRDLRGDMPREEFAGKLGYEKLSSGAQQIWRWETGKTLPNRDGAWRLSRYSGRSVAFFLGEDDPEEEADLVDTLYAFLGDLRARRLAKGAIA